MSDLTSADFPQFFFELHGCPPFPWQERLAQKVCSGMWPEVIDLPTASGKTACLDIALFSLALLSNAAPRRMFFVVDRRIVVNEAYLRMSEVAEKLKHSKPGVLATVAARLRTLAGSTDPLLVYEMRGGAFRDETWVKNPQQPLVVTSTVDQVGSRLLFRGYGVAENSWPIHAGLIGNDALILLDEAHCSRAFAQTLQRIERYRSDAWAPDYLKSSFHFVEMTATPSRETQQPFRLEMADRENQTLRTRLHAKKLTTLIEVKAKKDDFGPVATELSLQAVQLANRTEGRRIAIFANRVATAKLVHRHLCEQFKDRPEVRVELVIGAMRAVDRDDLYKNRLQILKSGTRRNDNDPLTFVVSTQCLEVGADLDFDALACECASVDALQQRFGRLDRLGEFKRALAVIVIASWQVAPKQPDPVYGFALSLTWNWLKVLAGEAEVNMGIESGKPDLVTVAEVLKNAPVEGLRLLGPNAPVLLPTHVDALTQTSPVPTPDPSIDILLHGPKSGSPDVNVVWRRDLDDLPVELWKDVVQFCPPSSLETMTVKIGVFKKWFAGETCPNEHDSDLDTGTQESDPKKSGRRDALVWQGEKTGGPINSAREIRPGQTIILRAKDQGWNELGYIPPNHPIDVGDEAAFSSRKSVSLRLHPNVISEWPDKPGRAEIIRMSRDVALEWGPATEHLLQQFAGELEGIEKPWPWPFLVEKLSRRELNSYPDPTVAHVITARRKSPIKKATDYVGLKEHVEDVVCAAAENSRSLSEELQRAFQTAAQYHDYGKADIRFQAWLRGGDLLAARYSPAPIAKSGRTPIRQPVASGLPEGFRHELLSLIFALKDLGSGIEQRDLILHLVASHHGRCRPFAPVVLDENAGCVSYEGSLVCAAERVSLAAHRLDSGVADRFWSLTRRFGWWGLPYLEALFRLADWKASDNESAAVWE